MFAAWSACRLSYATDDRVNGVDNCIHRVSAENILQDSYNRGHHLLLGGGPQRAKHPLHSRVEYTPYVLRHEMCLLHITQCVSRVYILATEYL